MGEIFISYRRVDTTEPAHALYRDLRDRFGIEHVFMDTSDTSLPWGSKWQAQLSESLAHSEALLVLIGPCWSSCRRADGRRRLDVEDDWVRREIATGLARNILVLPILFAEGISLQKEDLPPDIRALADIQWHRRPMNAVSWDDELDALLCELKKSERLRDLYQMAAAKKGVPLLRELFAENTAARDAAIRSRVEIAHTSEAIRALAVAKTVHDALHTIEVKCVEFVRNKTSEERPVALDVASTHLATATTIIRDAAHTHTTQFPLLGVLVERLDEAAEICTASRRDRTVKSLDALIQYLDRMLPSFLDGFDVLIATLAAGVHVNELSTVVNAVRQALPPETVRSAGVKPLAEVSDALTALGSRLARLVKEHGRLQRLDLVVNAACKSLIPSDENAVPDPADVTPEHHRIETEGKRLVPPFSPELLMSGINALEPCEAALKTAAQTGDARAYLLWLKTYATELLQVFWMFDAKLKELCSELDGLCARFDELVTQGG